MDKWNCALAGSDGVSHCLRRHNTSVFLGDDILAWLILALGGALAVGNIMAIVKPPTIKKDDGDLVRAPLSRSIVMATVGAIAALWALFSLLS